MVLGLGRVLVTQNNEEIMLTRLSQLGISKQTPSSLVFTQDTFAETTNAKDENDSADFYAQFFVNAVNIASNELNRYVYSTICDKDLLISLEKLTLRLLIMFSAVLKSGKYFIKCGV